jgi:hypothetical protein
VSDAVRADALSRAAGAKGVAPAAGRGGGCHRGLGWGSGERGGLRAAQRKDGRGEAESISSLPGTEPIRIPPPPGLPSTKRHPPACRQGAVPELKLLELVEGRQGPSDSRFALRADAVIPAGGAWGSQVWQHCGCWARRWQASHVESEAKRLPKQHCSAIDQRVLIFMGDPAASGSSQHCRHTRCDLLFVSIDQRWPDIETQPNRDIPKPQIQKLCGAVK